MRSLWSQLRISWKIRRHRLCRIISDWDKNQSITPRRSGHDVHSKNGPRVQARQCHHGHVSLSLWGSLFSQSASFENTFEAEEAAVGSLRNSLFPGKERLDRGA